MSPGTVGGGREGGTTGMRSGEDRCVEEGSRGWGWAEGQARVACI